MEVPQWRGSPTQYIQESLTKEAVKMITEGGLKASAVARLLSIPKSTITYWIRAEKKGRHSAVGGSKNP